VKLFIHPKFKYKTPFQKEKNSIILDPHASQEPSQIRPIPCTFGLLPEVGRGHCVQVWMDREVRVVYILGEILDFNGEEGAMILEITPAAFRKRLSRARSRIRPFMRSNCGLINPNAPCRCERQIPAFFQDEAFNELRLSKHPKRRPENQEVLQGLKELDELERIVALYRNHPEFSSPQNFVENIKSLVQPGQYNILDA